MNAHQNAMDAVRRKLDIFRPPPLSTYVQHIITQAHQHSVYVYVTSFEANWSSELSQMVLHLDAYFDDPNYTHVHIQTAGYNTYFSVELPLPHSSDTELPFFVRALENRVFNKALRALRKGSRLPFDLKNAFYDMYHVSNKQLLEILEHEELRQPLVYGHAPQLAKPFLYYQAEPMRVIRIYVTHPALMRPLAQELKKMLPTARLFDVETPFVVRYLADRQLKPASWYRISPDRYHSLMTGAKRQLSQPTKYTRPNVCELFVPDHRDILYVASLTHAQLTAMPLDESERTLVAATTTDAELVWQKRRDRLEVLIPNFRVFCFDIEVRTTGHSFPQADKDDSILITADVYRMFDGGYVDPVSKTVTTTTTTTSNTAANPVRKPVLSMAISNGSVKSEHGASAVFITSTEKDMLEMFQMIVTIVDPDVILHHHGNGFDIPYLLTRAAINRVIRFEYLGRNTIEPVKHRENQNKGWTKHSVTIPGRMNIDLLRLAQDAVPAFEQCTLDYLANFFFKEHKEYLLPDLIGKKWTSEQGRTDVLRYGLKDVHLTRRVADRMQAIVSLLEMVRITGSPFQRCVDYGQGDKMQSLVYYYMNAPEHKTHCFVLEWVPRKFAFGSAAPGGVNNTTTNSSHKPTTVHDADDDDDDDDDELMIEAADEFEERFQANMDTMAATTKKSNAGADGGVDDDNVVAAVEDDDEDEDEGYEGAAVLTTIGGFYGYLDYEKVTREWLKLCKRNKGIAPVSYTLKQSHLVATIDAASMYPTIIRRWNLCLSTLLREPLPAHFVEGEHFWRRPITTFDETTITVTQTADPCGPAFVLPCVFQGVLAWVETALGTERSRVKKQKLQTEEEALVMIKDKGERKHMSEADASVYDGLMRRAKVLNIRQDRIKLMMNSIYGLTGDPNNKFNKKDIAETVTACGRYMIRLVQSECVRQFNTTTNPECPFTAELIGGDTDSVFVHMRGMGITWMATNAIADSDRKYLKEDLVDLSHLPGKPRLFLKEPFQWGCRMAEQLTKKFEAPCKFEFEKLISNHNNILRKNYYGVKWMLEQTERYGTLFMKGIQAKKRGLPPFVKQVATECIELTALKSNVPLAIEHSLKEICRLVEGRVSVTSLALMQKLSRDIDSYKTNTPAVVLGREMKRLDPSIELKAGEIMRYVMIDWSRANHDLRKRAKIKRADQVMEPMDAMLNDVPLDLNLYKTMIETQLYRLLHYPLRRILVEGISKRQKSRTTSISTDNNATTTTSYPNLSIGKDVKVNKQIRAAVLNQVYASKRQLLNPVSAPVGDNEHKSTNSILKYVTRHICPGCNKSSATAMCATCRAKPCDQVRTELENQWSDIDGQSMKLWSKCDTCMMGNKEDAQHCRNVSCEYRGDRHLVDNQLQKTKSRLDQLNQYDW